MRPQDLLPDSSSAIQLVMRRLGCEVGLFVSGLFSLTPNPWILGYLVWSVDIGHHPEGPIHPEKHGGGGIMLVGFLTAGTWTMEIWEYKRSFKRGWG